MLPGMRRSKGHTSSPLRLGLSGSSVGRMDSVHRGGVQDRSSTRFSRSNGFNFIRQRASYEYTEQNTRFPSTFTDSARGESGDEHIRNQVWDIDVECSKTPHHPAGFG